MFGGHFLFGGRQFRPIYHLRRFETLARTVQRKTAKEIEQLAKQSGKNFVEPALYLQVNGAAVSWLHRYTLKGKSRWSGLGSYPQLSLAGARAKLKDEQTKIRAGVD